MSRWKKTIKIKDALGSDTSADGIIKASNEIIERLKGSGAPFARIEESRDIAKHDPETALQVFNDGLDVIYDWADDTRVWLS